MGQLVAWGTLYYAYAILAPAIAEELGIAGVWVALGFSGTLLVSGLLAPLVGRWLDAHGAVVVLRRGALLGPAALMLLAAARTPLTLGLGFLLLGLAQAVSLYEPAFRAAVDWFADRRRRTRALLLITAIGGFASTVFLPVTAVLVREQGWRTATVVLALVLAVVSTELAALLPGRGRSVASASAVGAAAGASEAGARWLGIAFAGPAFASAAAAVALVWLLVERGAPIATAAAVTGLAGAAQVPGRLLLEPIRRCVGTPGRVTGILAVQAVALATVAAGPDSSVALAVLAFGACNGMLTLERPVVVAEWFGETRFGVVSGAIARDTLVARATAPLAVTGIATVATYQATFIGVAMVIVLGALGFVLAARAITRPHPAPSAPVPWG